MSTANFKELDHGLPFYALDTSGLDDWELGDIHGQLFTRLRQVNIQELCLFTVSAESGYYTGLQLYAQVLSPQSRFPYSREELEELDDDSAYYLFDCSSAHELMELYEQERQYIAQLFGQIAAVYGFIPIRCIGHASNGEAFYEEAC